MIKSKNQTITKKGVAQVAIGSLFSVLSALVLILLFALAIRFADVPNVLIVPINIFIKILSITIGVFFATKNGQKGLVKGVIVGIVFVVCAFFIFSIISNTFALGLSILIDIGLGIVVGAITGVIFVNIHKQ